MQQEAKVNSSNILPVQTVDTLGATLLPYLTDRGEEELKFLVSKVKDCWFELNVLNISLETETNRLKQDLVDATNWLRDAEEQIVQTKQSIASDRKTRSIIQDRIRVKLSNPNLRLPFFLAWMRAFALREHPLLTPLLSDKQLAVENVAKEQEFFTQGVKDLKQEQLPGIEQARQNLAKNSNFLLAFCDEKATQSLDLAKGYVSVLPDRAYKAASGYVEAHIYSPQILKFFHDFILHMRSTITDQASLSLAKRRYGHFLTSTEAIQEEDITKGKFTKLTPAAQRRFKEYAVFIVTAQWAKEGLIQQPILPDILRTP